MSYQQEVLCPVQELGLSYLQGFPNENTYNHNVTTTVAEWYNRPSGAQDQNLHIDQYQSSPQQCISHLDISNFEKSCETLTSEITEFLNEQPEVHNTTTYANLSPSTGLTHTLDYKGIRIFSDNYTSIPTLNHW